MMTDLRPWPVAILAGAGLLGLAFWTATLFEGSHLLSLAPPATAADPNPQIDTHEGNVLALYQAAFTAWAAVFLLIPAYYAYLTKGAGAVWLAFWTVSYLVYLVHLYVSAFLFFGGDFAWMTTSPRVSAFWPGMALIVWWSIDIALAVWRIDALWVRVQRAVLHIGTFVLFFGGSAIKGETATIKLIGVAFAGTSLLALWHGLRARRAEGVT